MWCLGTRGNPLFQLLGSPIRPVSMEKRQDGRLQDRVVGEFCAGPSELCEFILFMCGIFAYKRGIFER